MKTAIFTLLTISAAQSQIVPTVGLEPPPITSSVHFNGATYQYEYRVGSTVGGRDVSNIIINVCDSTSLYSIYGDDQFTIEFTDHSIKFDDIAPVGEEFVFGFSSAYSPELSFAYVKAATQTYGSPIYSPSCHVPEPSSAFIGVCGLTLLVRRRRNVKRTHGARKESL